MKGIKIILLILVLFSSSAFAFFGESSDIIITNFFPGLTKTQGDGLYCPIDSCCDSNATSWSIVGSYYLVNISGILQLNETRLNATIDDRVVAGTYNTTQQIWDNVVNNGTFQYDIKGVCPASNYAFGILDNGTLSCREDQNTGLGGGTNTTNNYLMTEICPTSELCVYNLSKLEEPAIFKEFSI